MTLQIDDTATVRVPGTTHDTTADATAADETPLLLVLHGYGAHEGDLVPLLEHLGHDGEAAALRAPLPMDHGGWAWFPITTIGAPDVRAAQDAADAVLAWIDEHAGGATEEIGAIVPGGAASGILPPEALDVPLTRDALREWGVGAGSAAVQVFPKSYSPLRLLAETMRFFAEESCGQCTPCRVGAIALAPARSSARNRAWS